MKVKTYASALFTCAREGLNSFSVVLIIVVSFLAFLASWWLILNLLELNS